MLVLLVLFVLLAFFVFLVLPTLLLLLFNFFVSFQLAFPAWGSGRVLVSGQAASIFLILNRCRYRLRSLSSHSSHSVGEAQVLAHLGLVFEQLV